MTDLAEQVGIYDPLWRERETLRWKQRRADRALALAWGGMIGALIFVALVGWYA